VEADFIDHAAKIDERADLGVRAAESGNDHAKGIVGTDPAGKGGVVSHGRMEIAKN
jgi:hypothetical protein